MKKLAIILVSIFTLCTVTAFGCSQEKQSNSLNAQNITAPEASTDNEQEVMPEPVAPDNGDCPKPKMPHKRHGKKLPRPRRAYKKENKNCPE